MSDPSGIGQVAATVARTRREPRAGGVDLTARHQIGRAAGPFVDLRGVAALHGISWRPDGSARIGATVTVAEVAGDARLRVAYPALTATAGALATPQVRAAATVGGNLLQRNRCWYYRNPHFSCYQTGGDTCHARPGLNLYSTVIDRGPCVAPHPSSLAMALLAYDAGVDLHRRGVIPIRQLYGDGSDPTRDHLLDGGEILVAVDLPPPRRHERASYYRATSRSQAEWPLVEAVARVVLGGTTMTFVAVTVGGVARTPLRLAGVEDALTGTQATPDVLRAAADEVMALCRPLTQTGYKVVLLRNTVLEVLERATASPRPGDLP